MRNLLPILLMACPAAFGQLQTDTITITAMRHVHLQPDQIIFDVQVFTTATAGVDDALAEVPGSGITAADLTGVFTYNPNKLRWNFTLAVPFSQAAATTKLLTQIQQQSNQSVTVSSQGTQVSQALQQSQPCSQANLISDARAQADSLAAAVGFSVGAALAISDGSLDQSPAAVARLGVFANVLSGAFTSVAVFVGVSSYVAQTPPPVTCSAVVKFQLYRYH